jgi:hypothetical protein
MYFYHPFHTQYVSNADIYVHGLLILRVGFIPLLGELYYRRKEAKIFLYSCCKFPCSPMRQAGIFFQPGKLEQALWINSISGRFSLHKREHISGLGINQNTLWSLGKIFLCWKWGFPCSET